MLFFWLWVSSLLVKLCKSQCMLLGANIRSNLEQVGWYQQWSVMIRICQYYFSLASTMFSARSQPAHHWLDVFGRVADKGRKRTPPCPFWSFWSSLSAECRAKTWRLRLATAVTGMGQNYSELGVHVHVDSVDPYMNPVNACNYVSM